MRYLDVRSSGRSLRPGENAVASLTRTFARRVDEINRKGRAAQTLHRINSGLRGSGQGRLNGLHELREPQIVGALALYPSLFRRVRSALGLAIPEMDRLERMAGGGRSLRDMRADFRPMRITLGELGPYLCFSDEEYQRVWYTSGNGAEILILCWKPGQFTEVHHHGRHRGLDAVLMGRMEERLFRRGRGGRVVPERTLYHGPGEGVIIGEKRIHQAGCPIEDSGILASVHMYLSPLLRF